LTWIDNCGYESGYRIERDDGGGFTQIAEVNADVTTYTDEGLTYGQSYYYRVKAYTDQNESAYSNESDVIEIIISAPTNLTATIIDEQSVQLTWEDKCTFETGYKIERKEEGEVYSEITDLSANVEDYTDEGLTFGVNYTYRIQAYTNSNLSEYSEEVITNVNVVVDIDRNVYQSVKIGNQWWMAENLKVTHYRNGDAIPNVINATDWSNLTTGAYCNYDNDDSYVSTYGSLYNWYAVNDTKQIAPAGWHVPTDEEWKQLEMHLGMSPSEADDIGWRGTNEGGKLKETGTTHWYSPNTGATNESGFNALPGGRTSGTYYNMGHNAGFWSSTENDSLDAWHRYLSDDQSKVYRSGHSKQHGFSVRCVRD